MNPIQPVPPFHPLAAVTLAVTLTLLLLRVSTPAVSLAGSSPLSLLARPACQKA